MLSDLKQALTSPVGPHAGANISTLEPLTLKSPRWNVFTRLVVEIDWANEFLQQWPTGFTQFDLLFCLRQLFVSQLRFSISGNTSVRKVRAHHRHAIAKILQVTVHVPLLVETDWCYFLQLLGLWMLTQVTFIAGFPPPLPF